MRHEVLLGQARPEGLAAVAYHGLVEGLVVLLHGARPPSVPAPSPAPGNRPAPPDAQLVALLASMVLGTHPEVRHVF